MTESTNTETTTPDDAPEAAVTDTTPEAAVTDTAPEAPAEDAAAAEVPGVLGKLTPEEQSALMQIRNQSNQLLAKVGEHEVLKMRVLAKIDELDAAGQQHINAISARFDLSEGQQWVALQDGTVRLVPAPNAGQTELKETPPASS